MLRTFLGDSAPTLPAIGSRTASLKARSERSSLQLAVDKARGNHSRGFRVSHGDNGLQWSYFEILMPEKERNPDYKRIHTQYRSFLRATQKLLMNDEISTEELHDRALKFYRICKEKSTKNSEKKSAIAKYAPTPSDNDLNSAIAIASELDDWKTKRQELLADPSANKKATPNANSSADWFDSAPFGGAAIDFNYNAEYFSDDETTMEASDMEEIDLSSSSFSDASFGASNGSKQSQMNLITAQVSGKVDKEWLREECEKYVKASKSDSHSSSNESEASFGMTTSDYVDSLLSILSTSGQSETELQNSLINVLGHNGFDFAMMLLANRPKLLRSLAQEFNKMHFGFSNPSSADMPSNFTVNRKSDLDQEKKREKEKDRLLKLAKEAETQLEKARAQLSAQGLGMPSGASFDVFAARRQRIAMLSEQLAPEKLRPARKDDEENNGMKSAWHGAVNAIRKEEPTCETVFVPCPETHPLGKDEKLLPISENFEPFAQLAFSGIERLNRIQSRVYECAYKTNNNMLICAPTGAGKTNIALMTMLHEIGTHIGSHDGVIRLDEFKIVYVAPMKALAAEMTENFGRRLLPLNVKVKELTGDMQLTKKEIQETQVIVTTPEKWDVITRKSNDNSLALLVKLLIIDEVHLLHEDRGAVIESLVARTLRQVEQTQAMIRIVGLSATLPNYRDVAQFLRVDPQNGLFFFDGSYRPVPMSQEFIGVRSSGLYKPTNASAPPSSQQAHAAASASVEIDQREEMNSICWERAHRSLKQKNQVMIFVHSRKDTVLTARKMVDLAGLAHAKSMLQTPPHKRDYDYEELKKSFADSKNRDLALLFQDGVAFHNAGMLRSDRNIVERAFSLGFIKVLVCTATLAWGVNLPAHTVIIKGTQIYAAEKGTFVDLGVLDIMQIFGRAGRPQFDTSGEAILITTIDRLSHFLQVMSVSVPIESNFEKRIVDHLNAEIVLGTVTNVRDAVQWLSYTYLWIRMSKNPQAYGINVKEIRNDPTLSRQHLKLIKHAATELDKCKMIRYDEAQGGFHSTELGRIASHFYIQFETILLFNEFFDRAIGKSKKKPLKTTQTLGERVHEAVTTITREELEEEMAAAEGYASSGLIDPRDIHMNDEDLVAIVSEASEFSNVRLRDEEMEELEKLDKQAPMEVKHGDKSQYKVNVLIQSYISQSYLDSFSLASDMAYVSQNIGRIFRALFEITFKKNWPRIALQFLQFCKMVEHRMWPMSHPLRQLHVLGETHLARLEDSRTGVDRLLDMTIDEITSLVRANHVIGKKIYLAAKNFPRMNVSASVQPVTRTVIKLHLTITADFYWNEKVHGTVEPFHIWIEDAAQSFIYHSEYFLLHRKQKDEPQHMTLIVPIEDPPPSQYIVHIFSDRWLGCETVEPILFDSLILPHEYPPHTALLPLQPLQLQCLQDAKFESIYNFTHFNAVQTQVFHTLYHTDSNVLLGAPTGSGKTNVAELAMLKLFRDSPGLKVVYIAPLKALVRERMKDWAKRMRGGLMGKKLVELTGDYTPDIQALMSADIVTTTPEKWDGISRNWQQRDYVQKVGLVIIDEIHLLGEERGPILEVIVSRMRYIASVVDVPIRIVGLSTALANALDLADWLGIDRFAGLYNFRPSVRPVRLEVHISGFRGKHYCPRMATMNKPAFQAIKTYSRDKPALIFVSSRRQTRLTAIDLISCIATDDEGQSFLHMTPQELEVVVARCKDQTLKHTLTFGIGLHHAGLPEDDKALVEDLFGANKIQVLVSTATLAWGVNLPAHLVIVKGTEFYDAATKRYVDYPITDVLQMMGRAGRPQYDTEGFACVFVEESKKAFYTKFLYEPFPVESQLKNALHDHINAEIVAGTIKSKQDAVDYLTWTFFFRRLLKNPSYYGLENTNASTLNKYLSDLVDTITNDLKNARCIEIVDDFSSNSIGSFDASPIPGGPIPSSNHSISSPSSAIGSSIVATNFGRVASYYYLHYSTMQVFRNKLMSNSDLKSCLETMVATHEFSELPVRHNEDELNLELSKKVTWLPSTPMDSPHTKSNLLIQSHLSQLDLPISDFYTDTRQVLDQTVRVAQAMVDVCAESGWLQTAFNCIHLLQMCIQGRWMNESTTAFLPGLDSEPAQRKLAQAGIYDLPTLLTTQPAEIARILSPAISQRSMRESLAILRTLPSIDVHSRVQRIVLNEEGKNECTIVVSLNRTSETPRDGIYAPRYSKHKDEGWWLVVGNEMSGELLALRKLNNTRPKMNVQLSFVLSDDPADRQGLTLFFMSDCYIGLDQQYSLKIE